MDQAQDDDRAELEAQLCGALENVYNSVITKSAEEDVKLLASALGLSNFFEKLKEAA